MDGRVIFEADDPGYLAFGDVFRQNPVTVLASLLGDDAHAAYPPMPLNATCKLATIICMAIAARIMPISR